MDKEQKAKEYADVYFYATDDSFESEERKYVIEHFKAGFEAGKQERDREIIEKLNDKLKISIDSYGNLHIKTKVLESLINEIENLSK